MGNLSSIPGSKADVDLANVSDAHFASKAAAAGVGGGSTGPIAIADVTGLQGALDDKSDVGHVHAIADVTGLQEDLDGKAATVHTHTIAQVNNLQNSLDGKSDTGHTHTIANITNLQNSLDAKAALDLSNITDAMFKAKAASAKVGDYPKFNIKNYGAIGDGNSHPLSGLYANLAAAQVDYPHATALTNELDWAATQKALNLAGVNGGRVVSPVGWYRFDQELVIPEMPNADDGWNAVDILGDGMRNTVWEWRDDLGAGKFAIRPPDQVNSYMRTKISDITFYGPRDFDALDTKPSNMDGVAVAHRYLLDRVAVQWFRAGISVLGDHSNFYHCEISKNYYGVYWAGDATNRGDHNFVSCDINGNKRANLAVHPLNTIDAAFFMGCHMGFAPHAILAEQDNGGNVRSLAALSNTSMIDCSFEAIGNAIFYAEGALTDYNGIVTTYFSQCSGTQDNNYKISANPFTAWIVANVDRCFFIGGHGMFGSHGTDPTAIFGGKFTNSQFEDFRDLTLSSTIAFAKNDCSGSKFRNGNIEGFISYVYDGNCVYGTVVGHWYESVGAMTANSLVAGVVLNNAPADAQFGLIATTGFLEVKKTTTAAINTNDLIQASTTYGSVETATASTRPIMGIAKFGAGSADATVWMWLQMTHRM